MTLPDIESLRCFVAAAAHKSFRRAAREVGLSPAAFSDRISRLEEVLGARLFARTTRSVLLTPDGEKALAHAKRALAEARACTEVTQVGPQPFDLTLGTRFELGMSWLVPGLSTLAQVLPERRLHLTFGDTEGLLRTLEQANCDAVVTSTRLSQVALEAAALHEELYVLVASPKLVLRRPLTAHGDAARHTLLDATVDLPLFRYFLDGRPAKESWRFAHIERLGTIGAIAARARAGCGIAVLPRYFVEGDLKKNLLCEPFPSARLSSDFFRLVWRKDHPRDADLRRLASDLRAMPLK